MASNDEASKKVFPEEERLTQEIERNKLIYKDAFDKLKNVKAEIERIQLLLEKSREKMQKDFEKWLAVMLDQRKIMAPKLELSIEFKKVKGFLGFLLRFFNKLPKVNDKDVEKKLEAFYKARDEIYKNH